MADHARRRSLAFAPPPATTRRATLADKATSSPCWRRRSAESPPSLFMKPPLTRQHDQGLIRNCQVEFTSIKIDTFLAQI
jgi:hypothetical protein